MQQIRAFARPVRVAEGGGRTDSYYARAMLEIRSTLHLSLRVGVRAEQVLQHSGAASKGAGPWHAALPAFVVLDLVVYLVLRRSDRFGLAWRLPLDTADAVFWALSPLPAGGSIDWSTLIVVPLAVEAGVRLGWRALAVPGTVAVCAGGAALSRGKPFPITGPGWLVIAVGLGAIFYRYCGRLHERAETERHRRLAAARRRAFLAGQNEVAMGASSAVDVIEGLVPVLGRPAPGSALSQLAGGWKGRLSASTAAEATYLQVALLEWERAHNAHPDLSGLVTIGVPEGEGTTMLSGSQVARLQGTLDGLRLRGSVEVRRAMPDTAHVPGQELRLTVGGRAVVVPADRRGPPPAMDPVIIAYACAAAVTALTVLPQSGGLPPVLAALALAMCVTAGFVSQRWTVTRGVRSRRPVVVVASLVATALMLVSLYQRNAINTDGDALLGFGAGLLLLSFLGGFYWRSLGGWRWLAPAVALATVVLNVALFPVPSAVTAGILVASVMYGTFPFFTSMHLSRSLDRALAAHAASAETADREVERAAFVEGRESVIGLVRQARADALVQLAGAGSRLDGDLAELAARRLLEVDRRLESIGG